MTSPWAKEFAMPVPPKPNGRRRRAEREALIERFITETSEISKACFPYTQEIFGLFRRDELPPALAWAALAMAKGMLLALIERGRDADIAKSPGVVKVFEEIGHDFMADHLAGKTKP